jgi:hypothetical protein
MESPAGHLNWKKRTDEVPESLMISVITVSPRKKECGYVTSQWRIEGNLKDNIESS